MKTQLIETFIKLTENLSFSKTAKYFNTSQPVISRQVKELEELLGVELFRRTKRSVKITEEGRGFLQKIERPFLDLKEAFNGDIIAAEKRISFRIAATKEAGENYLLPRVVKLKKKFPHVHFSLYLVSSKEIEELIIKNEVDVGFVYTLPVRKSFISFEMKKDFPSLVGPKKINFSDLKSMDEIPFVTYWKEDDFLQSFLNKNINKKEQNKCKIAFSVNSHPKMLELVKEFNYFAVMPYSSVEDAVRNGEVFLIHHTKDNYNLSLICAESLLADTNRRNIIQYLHKLR